MEIKEFSLREITFSEQIYTKDGNEVLIKVTRRRTCNNNDFISLEVGDYSITFNQNGVYDIAAKTACELLSKAVNHPCELPTTSKK